MVNAEKVELTQLLQVGVVVRDLQKAVECYWNIFGIGPWQIYTIKPPYLISSTVRNKHELYTMRMAIAWIGNVQWELIEPLTGPSIYKEFLEKKGEGLHHVACAVNDYEQTVAYLKKQGISILMSGTTVSGTYSYMDTEESLGTIVEIYNRPHDFKMTAPESVYPPSA